jgi:hypothetical protein
MTYDSVRNRVVVFGGWTGSGFLNDTWEFDGANWLQQTPALSPSPREKCGLAFDDRRVRSVLFGGGGTAETWEWDGSAWLQQFPATTPPTRAPDVLTFDAARGFVVMLLRTPQMQTWEWDGVNWALRTPVNSPGTRDSVGLTYDPARQRVVLFGGSGPNNETWEWDGTDWLLRLMPSSPPARGWPSFAFDPVRERCVLFGGWVSWPGNLLGDTWEYSPVSPAISMAYGTGCGGTLGPPLLSATRPWLGDTLTVSLHGAAASSAGLFWLGGSSMLHGTSTLPMNLAAFGAPNCSLLASIDATRFLLTDPTGTATFTLAVPNAAALIGLTLYGQGVVVDPSANAAHLAMTNGLRLDVGSR